MTGKPLGRDMVMRDIAGRAMCYGIDFVAWMKLDDRYQSSSSKTSPRRARRTRTHSPRHNHRDGSTSPRKRKVSAVVPEELSSTPADSPTRLRSLCVAMVG